MVIKYLSLFSGIEAATVAWHPLGFEPLAFAEIEPFPSAVLKHHYPGVPNLGDVTKADYAAVGNPDLIVFGSPCQSFSVAGKRLGLDDPRGNLALYALGVVGKLRPKWFLFENVPGLLSSGKGRDFGAFLGAVGDIGYQCAWRVLDAQYFGVPQRRRRVFVVGHLGDWRYPAAVLLERESLSGNPPPGREAGEGVAPGVTAGPPFSRTGNERVECEELVAKALRGASNLKHREDCETYVPGISHALNAGSMGTNQNATGRNTPKVQEPQGVRRLTPRECERLQGFPDDYTRIPYRGKPAADGPRYKALGNSMAVPVMSWLGRRIKMAHELK